MITYVPIELICYNTLVPFQEESSDKQDKREREGGGGGGEKEKIKK